MSIIYEWAQYVKYLFRSVSDRRNSHTGSAVIQAGLEFRYPSRFGNLEEAIEEEPPEPPYHSTKNDRTTNYRKCLCPFILGVILMVAGIALRKFVS